MNPAGFIRDIFNITGNNRELLRIGHRSFNGPFSSTPTSLRKPPVYNDATPENLATIQLMLRKKNVQSLRIHSWILALSIVIASLLMAALFTLPF